jgi:phosphoesterase RecJ-like protein
MGEALAESRKAAVCGHVDPDGDAVGSLLGLALALESLGIEVTRLTADDRPPPDTYAFLPGFDGFRRPDPGLVCDTFVTLDTPDPERLGTARTLAEAAGRVLVLDHHPDAVDFGDVNLLDAEAAAVGQMIWRLLPSMETTPDGATATCLYTALVTDTGRFQYSNTSPEALRVAAEMLDHGVDVSEVYRRLYESTRLEGLALRGRVLSRIAPANDGRVAWTWLDEADLAETGAQAEDMENLVDAVRVVRGVEVVFLAKAGADACKVSLRAKGDFDVGAVARVMGGGGHRAAAGFTSALTKDAVVERLLPLLPGGR